MRHPVAAFGKDKLKLRIYPTRQAEPEHRKLERNRVEERVTAAAGRLVLEDLPDRPAVRWNGKELFRY